MEAVDAFAVVKSITVLAGELVLYICIEFDPFANADADAE